MLVPLKCIPRRRRLQQRWYGHQWDVSLALPPPPAPLLCKSCALTASLPILLTRRRPRPKQCFGEQQPQQSAEREAQHQRRVHELCGGAGRSR